MNNICFVTTCKGPLDYLKKSLPTFLSQGSAECIVVDYSCPDRCSDWVNENYSEVHVIRHLGSGYFHLTHARNLAIQYIRDSVKADWICFVDSDTVMNRNFYKSVELLLKKYISNWL